MNLIAFCGTTLIPRPGGTLYWPDAGVLCVSDLHLGKSERMARRGGALLPPYETRDTLTRLEAEISATAPRTVICLGDSFDDPMAGLSLPEEERLWLGRLMSGRDWVWIEGNHDPGPLTLPGHHTAALRRGPLVFRHIATAETGEISGHYHPKMTLALGGRQVTRACFLTDRSRIVMPAFGAYTGGLRTTDPVLRDLMQPEAVAILTGAQTHAVPMFPRRRAG